ncbi:MAG: associated golgi family protein [Proteobacteria bacterium]|nr:associated golgi family protein [Pseudomonadota bacterium]
MELITLLVDVFLHLDRYLGTFLHDYGLWVYALLFVIIFAETGFVVTPFLPGDSLLFVAGTLAASGGLEVQWLIPLLIAASFGGDNTNYWIGHHLGPRVFRHNNSRLLNHEYLDRTRAFYDRHGGKTILLARFLPILRTFAPFVAGVGRMPYARFLAFSLAGSVSWIMLFVLAGYFFGHLPVVRQNLTLMMLGIIIISILPGAIAWLRHRRGG